MPIFHRWFVQYNPFYFASALLVLAGVFLVTRDPDRWEEGHLALAAVMQLYELALIAGAGLLFGLRGQRRPAVILGMVAMAFLLDPSFRTEGLASIGADTLPAAVAWILLLGLKLALLGRALRVRLPLLHCALWILAGAVVALGPHLIGLGMRPAGVLVAACWLGIGLVILPAPKIAPEVALNEWGWLVLARLSRIAPMAWAALYWIHVLGWSGIYGVGLGPLCFAPLLVLLPLVMPREQLVWVVLAIGLAVASQRPAEFATVAALLALGAAIKAYRADWPRLYVAATLAAYLAAAGLQLPPPGLALLAASVLALLAWHFRLASGALAAAACAAPALIPLLPQTLARWGTLSLGAGFVALAAGLSINYWASRPR
jgi:hypothetical protein